MKCLQLICLCTNWNTYLNPKPDLFINLAKCFVPKPYKSISTASWKDSTENWMAAQNYNLDVVWQKFTSPTFILVIWYYFFLETKWEVRKQWEAESDCLSDWKFIYIYKNVDWISKYCHACTYVSIHASRTYQISWMSILNYTEELYLWIQMCKSLDPDINRAVKAPLYKVCVMSDWVHVWKEQVTILRIHRV